MHSFRYVVGAIGLSSLLFVGNAVAQTATPEAKPAETTIPVRVTVTISRHQGDKRVSNLPYVLTVNVPATAARVGDAGRGNLRMGTRVPVVGVASTKDATPTVNYQDVGTSIDCAVDSVEGGQFRVEVVIDESSVTDDPTAKGLVQVGRPSFRSFRTVDSLLMRDGQTKELTAVPDKLTGEVVKVEVALAIVK